MRITREELVKQGWSFMRRISRNCEIWTREEGMILWNRETLKVYVIC